jgi:DNA transformation protein
MQGRVMPMPYWRAPERLLDEPDEFAEWARTAFAVAVRIEAAKAGPKKKASAKRKGGKRA